MTWYFSVLDVGAQMDVYDHNGTLIAEHVSFSWPWRGGGGEYPAEILEVMEAAAFDAYDDGEVERALLIVANAAFDAIEEGTPQESN